MVSLVRCYYLKGETFQRRCYLQRNKLLSFLVLIFYQHPEFLGGGLSNLCLITFDSYTDNNGDPLHQQPAPTYDVGSGVLNFAGNEAALNEYISHCNSICGHTLTTNLTYSEDCGLIVSTFNNFLSCIGPSCTYEDQIDAITSERIVPGFTAGSNVALGNGCTVTATSTLYGEGPSNLTCPVPPDNTDIECHDDMATTFLYGVYDNFNDVTTQEENPGTYSGNATALGIFEAKCNYANGTLVTINYYSVAGCDDNDLIQVPFCVPDTCTSNEDASAAFDFVTHFSFDPECVENYITITDSAFVPSGAGLGGGKLC